MNKINCSTPANLPKTLFGVHLMEFNIIFGSTLISIQFNERSLLLRFMRNTHTHARVKHKTLTAKYTLIYLVVIRGQRNFDSLFK